jgi:hypothetical protein
MKISENIAYSIGRLPKGYVFTYNDFYTEVKSKEAVIKALNRMAESGKIVKLSKGPAVGASLVVKVLCLAILVPVTNNNPN